MQNLYDKLCGKCSVEQVISLTSLINTEETVHNLQHCQLFYILIGLTIEDNNALEFSSSQVYH